MAIPLLTSAVLGLLHFLDPVTQAEPHNGHCSPDSNPAPAQTRPHTIVTGWNSRGPGFSYLSAFFPFPFRLLSEIQPNSWGSRVPSWSSVYASQSANSRGCVSRSLLAVSRKGKVPGSGEQALRNRGVPRPGGRTRVSGGILSPLLTSVLPTTSLALALGPSPLAGAG